MSTTTREELAAMEALKKAWNYPAFEAFFGRRSRRYPVGAEIKEGPNAYKSPSEPFPLDDIEEALLIAAGTGINGINLADMPYHGADGGCDIMLQFTGRTWPSPCGSHCSELFYTNDSGIQMVKLRDVKPDRMREILEMDDVHRCIAVHKEHTLKLADSRLDLPRSSPALASFNLWNVNVPGTTVFMPVTDVTWEYINLLLFIIANGVRSGRGGSFIVDDLNGMVPAGTQRWADSGLLDKSLPTPLSLWENGLTNKIAAAEGMAMGHTILLAEQAMGLGGFLFSGFSSLIALGGTPLAKGLGFRFVTGKRTTGGGSSRLVDTSAGMPNPVGIDGVFEAYCPPYYKTMGDAVQAVVDSKWGPKGMYRPGGDATPPYRGRADYEPNIPRPSDEVVQCVKDICNYIYDTYGRFPAVIDTMQMFLWTQAHHLELGFYDRYYHDGAYTETQRDHSKIWHGK